MKRNWQAWLDRAGERRGEIPDDVPHWIVEMHAEFDERDLTPMEAVKRAAQEIRQNHCWHVIHVRSGLEWSVDLGRGEVIEIETLTPKAKQ